MNTFRTVIIKDQLNSLLDFPFNDINIDDIKSPYKQVWKIYLDDYQNGYYNKCIIEYHDLSGLRYPGYREMVVTRGGFKEAIQKASLFGKIIEIGKCGGDVYSIAYES